MSRKQRIKALKKENAALKKALKNAERQRDDARAERDNQKWYSMSLEDECQTASYRAWSYKRLLSDLLAAMEPTSLPRELPLALDEARRAL